jgi:hypothetical protein
MTTRVPARVTAATAMSATAALPISRSNQTREHNAAKSAILENFII